MRCLGERGSFRSLEDCCLTFRSYSGSFLTLADCCERFGARVELSEPWRTSVSVLEHVRDFPNLEGLL